MTAIEVLIWMFAAVVAVLVASGIAAYFVGFDWIDDE